jgi:MFS family permease
MLIATRVLRGLAAGMMVPQVFGIIRSLLDEAGRAKAFGAYGAVQGLASVAGPLLGGLLVDADVFGLGWRTIFVVNVPIGLVALLVGAKTLPESTSTYQARLDVVGALLSTAAVLLILFPLVQGPDWGWPWWGYLLMAAGALLLVGFLAFETRLRAAGGQSLLDPTLDPQLQRRPAGRSGFLRRDRRMASDR